MIIVSINHLKTFYLQQMTLMWKLCSWRQSSGLMDFCWIVSVATLQNVKTMFLDVCSVFRHSALLRFSDRQGFHLNRIIIFKNSLLSLLFMMHNAPLWQKKMLCLEVCFFSRDDDLLLSVASSDLTSVNLQNLRLT